MAARHISWDGKSAGAMRAMEALKMPKAARLELCIDIAEKNENFVAARACAMNLAKELFASQSYERIPEIARRYNLSRADLDEARKAAKRPAPVKKATEQEINGIVQGYVNESTEKERKINAVIQEYVNQETEDEYASRVHNAANALIEEVERMPLRRQRR
jgi:carboxylesterase type B